MSEKQITGGAPVLLVEDVKATALYFEKKLGFRTAFLHGEEAAYGIVERGDFSLHFYKAVPGAGRSNRSEAAPMACDAYVFVSDVDALHAELTERGADLLGPPQTWPYQMREFVARDCNGYHFCFGQDVSEAQE